MSAMPIDDLPEWLAASIREEAARRGVSPTEVLVETAVAMASRMPRVMARQGGFSDAEIAEARHRYMHGYLAGRPVDGAFLADVDSIIEEFKPILDRLAAT